MTHRPYPNHERARRQVERHHKDEAPATVPTARQAGERLAAALRAAQPSVDEYRLSTR